MLVMKSFLECMIYRVTMVVRDLGWVYSDLRSSPGCQATTVATYCPGSMMIDETPQIYVNTTQVSDHHGHPVISCNRSY